jgi:hypothetical protein
MGVIEYKRRSKRIQSKQTLRGETQKTIRALIITLGTMIVILSVVFLAFTTKNAENGYTFEQIKLKNEDLKTENANLKAKLTEITSFSGIDKNDKVTTMQPLDDGQKVYVTKEDNQVK